MDSHRFDNWIRNRALRLSRRDALRLASVGAASAALGPGRLETLAQSTCTLTLHGETAGDPQVSPAVDGKLTFGIGVDGSIANASFVSAGGTSQSVTGSINGRAFDVTIATASGQVIALSGVTDSKAPSCPGAAAGILSGPEDGVIGAWQASSAGSEQAGAITTQSGSGATGCTGPSFSCGPNCCPAGATCTDANQGICVCPGETTQCGLSCVPNCQNGQTLDLDTCTCPPPETACIQNQQACQNHGQCCSGYCGGGTCFDCAGKACGDFGCIDPSKDNQNCGDCGTICVDDTGFCLGGVCQCIPDGQPVGSSFSSCCSGGYVETSGLCGCAQLGEQCGSTGECCDNASRGVICVTGNSGFFACCLQSGSACNSDADCCFSAPTSIPQAACINGVCGVKT